MGHTATKDATQPGRVAVMTAGNLDSSCKKVQKSKKRKHDLREDEKDHDSK